MIRRTLWNKINSLDFKSYNRFQLNTDLWFWRKLLCLGYRTSIRNCLYPESGGQRWTDRTRIRRNFHTGPPMYSWRTWLRKLVGVVYNVTSVAQVIEYNEVLIINGAWFSGLRGVVYRPNAALSICRMG